MMLFQLHCLHSVEC